MRKLIIHAGTHKTGTTSIQNFLFENREALQEAGTHFFCAHKSGKRLKANAGRWVPNTGEGAEFNASIDPELAGRLGECRGETVVISAEAFSYINSRDPLNVFCDQLMQSFSSVQVVFYLRRQDKLAVSHYQQAAKWRSKSASRFYGGVAAAKALPDYAPHFDSYLNYDGKIRLWQQAFGSDAVTVRIFERSQLAEGCVVSDFVEQTGLPIRARAINENETLGRERTLLGHMMNAAGVPQGLQSAIDSGLDNDGRLMPSRRDANVFYDRYRESNRSLNQRLQLSDNPCLFDESFDEYPEKGNDSWTHEEASAVLGKVLNALRSAPGHDQQSFEILRRAANALQVSHPQLARDLLGLAINLRPRHAGVRHQFDSLAGLVGQGPEREASAGRRLISLGLFGAKKSA